MIINDMTGMVKHEIINKKVWISIQDVEQQRTITADEQYCSKCQQFKWVIGGIDSNSLCLSCLEVEHKVCQTRYCSYCNKHASIEMHACKTCIETLIKCTDELYKVCTGSRNG